MNWPAVEIQSEDNLGVWTSGYVVRKTENEITTVQYE